MSLNKVIILGNLGRDPELKYSAKQTAICNLNIATTEKQKDASGAWIDQTEWHRVVVFGKTAENCSNYLKKGSTALVEGKLKTSKYQDKKSGEDRYSTDIIADNVRFIGKPEKKKEQGNFEGYADASSLVDKTNNESAKLAKEADDSDIPF